MSEYVSRMSVCVEKVQSELKPWTDRNGNVRYYVNNIEYWIDKYRSATDTHLRSYYDWSEMRASGGRVREIIEGNILPNTKVYIDGEGYIHVYGWAAAGQGARMCLDEYIAKVVTYFLGYVALDDHERISKDVLGHEGRDADVGDVVEIVKGRKEVGKVFTVAKVTKYHFSQYQSPSVYLYDADGFKVNGDNCKVVEVGYCRHAKNKHLPY